jgi:cell division protein FtsA
MGGGTTDLAIYVDGDVWHTMVLPVGGNHITQDIAQGMRLPITQAEEIKKQHGHSVKSEIALDETISVRPFGEDQPILISRHDLAHIIEARVDEIFTLALQEIKRSGYDGLLPAGMVLTGGSSLLPGMRTQASRVLGMPVRTAQPENLVGLADKLNSPAYSTSVGLLYWATAMHEMLNPGQGSRRRRKGGRDWTTVRTWFKRLLP